MSKCSLLQVSEEAKKKAIDDQVFADLLRKAHAERDKAIEEKTSADEELLEMTSHYDYCLQKSILSAQNAKEDGVKTSKELAEAVSKIAKLEGQLKELAEAVSKIAKLEGQLKDAAKLERDAKEDRVKAAEELTRAMAKNEEADRRERSLVLREQAFANQLSSRAKISQAPDHSIRVTPHKYSSGVYVLPRSPGSKFHCREGCSRRANSDYHDILSWSDAVAKGYSACRICA